MLTCACSTYCAPRHIQALIDTATEAQAQFDKIVLEFGEEALQQEDSRRIMASLRKVKRRWFLRWHWTTLAARQGHCILFTTSRSTLLSSIVVLLSRLATKNAPKPWFRHIVTLCQDLCIELTAEGIETEEQIDVLLELGVRIGQGNLLGEAGTLPTTHLSPSTN